MVVPYGWEEHRIQVNCSLQIQYAGKSVDKLQNLFIITVARLLKVDEQKFSWALINYCTIQEGTAVKLRHTKTEAEAARDALACGIYFRLVDWIVTFINHKFSFTRTVL
jgi:myosin-3